MSLASIVDSRFRVFLLSASHDCGSDIVASFRTSQSCFSGRLTSIGGSLTEEKVRLDVSDLVRGTIRQVLLMLVLVFGF